MRSSSSNTRKSWALAGNRGAACQGDATGRQRGAVITSARLLRGWPTGLWAFLLCVLSCSASWACDPFSHSKFETDPSLQQTDTKPPVLQGKLSVESVTREGPRVQPDGSTLISSCSKFGFIRLQLEQTATDETSEQVGYMVVLAAGSSKGPLKLPMGPAVVRVQEDGTLPIFLWWNDEDKDSPIDFEVAVVAVDRAGNKSRLSNAVRVQHPGL